MSHLIFWILPFSTYFVPIKSDLSGNTIWPQVSGLQKSPKLTIFGIFNELLSTQKCKRSSLRSQCWMRHFLWFSNTVYLILHFKHISRDRKTFWMTMPLGKFSSFVLDVLSVTQVSPPFLCHFPVERPLSLCRAASTASPPASVTASATV